MRDDPCVDGLEILWIEIHLPLQQPMLIRCVYRPPKSNALYLDKICESIDFALDERIELFMLGDYNIDWKSSHSDGNKTKLNIILSSIYSRHLFQMVQDIIGPQEIHLGIEQSIIELTFCNTPNECSNAKSALLSWTNHNIVSITKYTKVPKRPARRTIRATEF